MAEVQKKVTKLSKNTSVGKFLKSFCSNTIFVKKNIINIFKNTYNIADIVAMEYDNIYEIKMMTSAKQIIPKLFCKKPCLFSLNKDNMQKIKPIKHPWNVYQYKKFVDVILTVESTKIMTKESNIASKCFLLKWYLKTLYFWWQKQKLRELVFSGALKMSFKNMCENIEMSKHIFQKKF